MMYITGSMFTIIAHDSKVDRMLMATDLVRARLNRNMILRVQALSKCG